MDGAARRGRAGLVTADAPAGSEVRGAAGAVRGRRVGVAPGPLVLRLELLVLELVLELLQAGLLGLKLAAGGPRVNVNDLGLLVDHG